jgi:glycosyltransferase involved in cell wall biosynthesis
MNWVTTVYHGLPDNVYRFHETPGEYFAFLGRISPEKRVDRAIEIAKRLDVPIKIAAKVDALDIEYFETTIRPLLGQSFVEYIGEIGEGEKSEFLGNAGALIFPIDWPEPFGIVMIESLATGTPVIAYRQGSVPEVITHGHDGFIVTNIDDAVTAAASTTIDRRNCRETFEKRFSAAAMARAYVATYERVILEPPEPPHVVPLPEAEAVATWRTPEMPTEG